MSIPAPDISSRPFHLSVACDLVASPSQLFAGWTKHLDRWLAAPGTVILQPQVDTAFCFETHHGSARHPYYGRILRLVPNELLELVWLSTGTQRLESILTLEFLPQGSGARLQITHAGLPDAQTRDEHEAVWPILMQELDRVCQQ